MYRRGLGPLCKICFSSESIFLGEKSEQTMASLLLTAHYCYLNHYNPSGSWSFTLTQLEQPSVSGDRVVTVKAFSMHIMYKGSLWKPSESHWENNSRGSRGFDHFQDLPQQIELLVFYWIHVSSCCLLIFWHFFNKTTDACLFSFIVIVTVPSLFSLYVFVCFQGFWGVFCSFSFFNLFIC